MSDSNITSLFGDKSPVLSKNEEIILLGGDNIICPLSQIECPKEQCAWFFKARKAIVQQSAGIVVVGGNKIIEIHGCAMLFILSETMNIGNAIAQLTQIIGARR